MDSIFLIDVYFNFFVILHESDFKFFCGLEARQFGEFITWLFSADVYFFLTHVFLKFGHLTNISIFDLDGIGYSYWIKSF